METNANTKTNTKTNAITNTEHCQMCGQPLTYLSVGKELTCHQCGKTEIGNIYCPNDHYICDDCHGKDLFEVILQVIETTPEKNPFMIAEELMGHGRVPMLGCENAWIAAESFLAALKNEGTLKVTDDQIHEALQRTRKQALGGYCGLTGVCGIAPAMGACFSVILGASCPKDQETSKTMSVVGDVIHAIASHTGPCCCKAFVRVSLDQAVEYAQKYFNVSLETADKDLVCTYVTRHPHGCRMEKCPYYRPDETAEIHCHSNNNYYAEEIQSLSKMEQLQKKALELGAQNAKIIQTDTIAVAEWVQLKCKYGCPLYNKDTLHPPFAPSAEETRKVIKEYDYALLLAGPDGPKLSQKAIMIEHEAYAIGYYKAFALLSLPFGTSPT